MSGIPFSDPTPYVGLPPKPKFGDTEWFQALEQFTRVFAIRPGERVLMLTDPLLDRRVVDAVLSGMHEQGTSHFELLEAFAPERLLRGAVTEATRAGYLAHEFGDLCLVWGAPRAGRAAFHPAAA